MADPSYLLQDDGVSRFLLDDGVSFLLLGDEQPETRWRLRPHTGGRCGVTWEPIASISDQPIVVIVAGDDFMGGVVNATTATAHMAVMLPDVHPASGDWQATSWATDANTNPDTYRALGPSPLDISLVAGSDYVVWMRLVDSAGTTIKRVVGELSIY